MPFTPKFVDLVRNATSVQGTGPVTLGAAVSGFTGLAAAVAPGEQFYYCIQSVDKPAEREVGRGTMQANGTIAREAISGSLTSFTSGAKTIALVAAAEWFSRLDLLGPGASPFDTATRSSLSAAATSNARPAYLCEAGREGLFVFDPSDLSAQVAADGAQGMVVPPAADPSGASGAWLRHHDGALRLEWFGAVPGDYATGTGADCLPAWNAAMAYLSANKRNVSNAAAAGAPQILFTGAQYYFSDTLQVKRTLRLTGMGSGQSGGEATWLRFPADKPGIVVNRHNTLGDAEQVPAGTGGDGTIIEGVVIHGNQGTTVGDATDLLKSGIRLRGRAVLRDVTVRNFAGAGVCISARTDVPASDPFYGNANNWRIDTARIEGNRAGGLFVSGGDANIGTAVGVDCTRNGRYNFFDGAFLGNAYYGCHSDVGGLFGNAAGSIETSHVVHSGTRYFLAYGTSHATAIATTPGTNAAVWKPMGAGTVDPQWKVWSATPAELYVPGGSYYQTGTANKAKFDGCYYEINHAPPQIMGAGIVDSGFMTEGLQTGAPHLVGSAGAGLVSQRPFTQKILFSDASWIEHAVGGDQSGNTVPVVTWNSSVSFPSDPSRKSSWLHDKVTGDLSMNFYNVTAPLFVAGYSTARTYGGRPQAEARYTVEIPNLHLGTGNDGNRITSGGVAPATGFRRRGDIHFNNGTGNSTNHTIFYYCSVSGTPGTWLRFAQLVAEPSLAIGYQTGAGGTITQGTSKSAAVTLHKPCGQVTMHNASLAAGAMVSFTLTSNKIAATDTVVVNIAAGASADSYDVTVTAVGNTTCRIQLRNLSAAALAEAVVLNFAVIKAVAA